MPKTITQYFYEARNRNKKHIALKYKSGKIWKGINWHQYFETSQSIGSALLGLGLQKGDRVAIVSNTRVEWSYTDMAILGVNGITVPIYQSYRSDEIEYILNDCCPKVLFCENHDQVKKWLEIKENCPSVETVVSFENNPNNPEDIVSLEQFIKKGEEFLSSNPNEFTNRCLNSNIDDDATILYTSGTTGQPKGVVLGHRQIHSEISESFGALNVDHKDSTLSFLPYAHILGRIELWGNVYSGFTLCFAENIDRIAENLKEVRPTIIISVPRIFEKIYNGVIAKVDSSPTKKKLFDWALSVGRQVSLCKRSKRPIPATILSQYLIAKKLVFDPFNQKLGGRIRFAVCGGAPLNKEIAEFFHAANFLILEGYGLTETTAAVCLNTPYDYKFGSVGKPLGDTEIKIAEDGEVLIKSHKVMKEYYNNPEATDEVMIDGFFATGDIGKLTPDGFLKITDRKKDLIKTAGGKYVAPQRLESLLKTSKYISNVLIHGDQKKYIVALITLDYQNVKQFAEENQLSYQNTDTLSQNPKVKELIRGVVADANSQLASFESIKDFHILGNDFTVESGELTPSLKVKRKYCDQKYVHLIDQLYGADSSTL